MNDDSRAKASPKKLGFFQFSLRQWIAFVFVSSILVGVLVWRTTNPWPHDYYLMRSAVRQLSFALETYHDEMGSYPPDNFPTQNSSEILYYHLCRPLVIGGIQHKPYMVWYYHLDDADANGYQELLSPWVGNQYLYKIIRDGDAIRFLVVDPGPDKLLGGRIDPQEGFVRDNSDANGDFKPDDWDNIYWPK